MSPYLAAQERERHHFQSCRIAKTDGFDDEECKEYAKEMQMEIIKLVSGSMVKDRIDMDANESGIFGLQAVESETLAVCRERRCDCSAEVQTAVRFIKSSAMDKVIKNEHDYVNEASVENANNICDTEYNTNEDMSRFREPTKQMDFLEYDIEDKMTKLVMYDFEGIERCRKLVEKFTADNKDNVKVVIFVLALDSYLEDCNDAVGNKMLNPSTYSKM